MLPKRAPAINRPLPRGASVGAPTSDQQGVFQTTQCHSTDTSGGGEYDTSTIAKTAKAVVTLEYAIDTGVR